MTASSGLDSSVDQDRDDETRNDDNFDDGKTRAWKHKYDRRAHNHHMMKGDQAPQNGIPDFLTGRQRQNSPLA